MSAPDRHFSLYGLPQVLRYEGPVSTCATSVMNYPGWPDFRPERSQGVALG